MSNVLGSLLHVLMLSCPQEAERLALISREQGECFASLQKENSIQPNKTARLASVKA